MAWGGGGVGWGGWGGVEWGGVGVGADVACTAASSGRCIHTSAATPVTWGVAMEVPLKDLSAGLASG